LLEDDRQQPRLGLLSEFAPAFAHSARTLPSRGGTEEG
jgi:hypothetical protein